MKIVVVAARDQTGWREDPKTGHLGWRHAQQLQHPIWLLLWLFGGEGAAVSQGGEREDWWFVGDRRNTLRFSDVIN